MGKEVAPINELPDPLPRPPLIKAGCLVNCLSSVNNNSAPTEKLRKRRHRAAAGTSLKYTFFIDISALLWHIYRRYTFFYGIETFVVTVGVHIYP